MEITCPTCGRYFDIDAERAVNTRSAKCVCGSRLRIAREASGSQRLGKYLLTRRIAVGGMGEIFYAKSAGIAGFQREVAIKKMLPHLAADRAFTDMMIKEAKLTVRLNHPNIVQVLDLAREGNDYYIAMEYVPGINVGYLLEHCYNKRSLLPVDAAVYITMQVLRGLAYAHDLRDGDGELMHILHRDITPQNILVTPEGWVKITDFGIAKARNEISTTSPGMIKGKLGYIAPEQLSGRAPDSRVDIFCAGILLWESLTSRRLFKGADEIDTFRAISEAHVPALGGIRGDVPPAVEKAMRQALAKDPDVRYAKADAFYDALAAAIAPRTIDELANATRAYFREQPEIFESVVSASERAPSAYDPTRVDTTPEQDLTPITELLARSKSAKDEPAAAQPEPRRRRLWPIAAVVTLLTLVAGGVAAWPSIAALHPDLLGGRALPQPSPGSHVEPPADPRLQPLTTSEVELAIKGETSRIKDCYCGAQREVRLFDAVQAKLAIVSTGGVVSTGLTPSPEKLGRAGGCLQEVLAQMLFRPTATPVFEASVALPSPKSVECAPESNTRPTVALGREAQLTGPEIQAVVQRNSQQIATCLQRFGDSKAPAKVDARLTIDTSGRVTDVDLSPPIEVPAVGRCLDKSLRGLRFHRQPTKDFKVSIPLKIQQLL